MTRELIDDRIIRQLTPIYDTRAFGYGSMLVAAKVDPEHPWRAAKIINSHPGVSHNYLRNHEFNMWFTLAVEEESKLGLQGTLDMLQELTGAESIRQLPTLQLFKIRMDLEMEGGTEQLTAAAAEAAAPVDLEKQPYDDFDIAVVRATQGDLPVVDEPFADAAAELGIGQEQLLEHMAAMAERGILRRVAAILFHRRAGFSANGMGVWQVPQDRIAEIGPRMAAFRGISHCYERPTYADWPYQIFTMAHGRSKEECDAVLDAIRRRVRLHRGPRDAVLVDRVQEDPPAVLHRRVQELGSRAQLSVPVRDTRSAELYARALRRLPGGVNSPVRAMRAIGRDPLFVASALGRRADRRRRQPLRRLDVLLGPVDPRSRRAVRRRGGQRRSGSTERRSALRPRARSSWPRRSPRRMPGVEMLRMTSSGTEATMSAIRLARAVTGRDPILKFAGAYHGHVDGLLAEAGSGLATQAIPASPGVTAAAAAATVIVPFNDAEAVERRVPGARVRGDRRRAVRRQHGPRPACGRASSSGFARRPTATAPCSCSTRSSPASESRAAARRS